MARCKRPEGLLIILRNLDRSMIARQAYRSMLITPVAWCACGSVRQRGPCPLGRSGLPEGLPGAVRWRGSWMRFLVAPGLVTLALTSPARRASRCGRDLGGLAGLRRPGWRCPSPPLRWYFG